MELKANKLRIGNILFCAERDIPYRVTAEDILVIDDGSSKSRPVPLTDEMLLKFGFLREGDFLELPINEDLSIIWVGYLGVMIGGYISFLIDQDKMHQLQNLYFALTNAELTVNL